MSDTIPELARLESAAEEASWLVARGYPSAAASAFVAEHRALDASERALLSCNARLNACVRHHIAREMDADDARKRTLVVDAASALATVAAALAHRLLLESEANVVADPSWRRDAFVESGALAEAGPALERLARVFDELRPARVIWLATGGEAPVLEGLVKPLGKRKWQSAVDVVADVPAAATNAAFVVSADPEVLDVSATWINAVGLAVEGLDPPRLRLTA